MYQNKRNGLVCVPTDCTGCSGGWPSSAFLHVIKYGIATEESYPYIAKVNYSRFVFSLFVSKESWLKYIKLNNISYFNSTYTISESCKSTHHCHIYVKGVIMSYVCM